MEGGKVDVEELRERIVVVKWGLKFKAARMVGPSFPPEPTVKELV